MAGTPADDHGDLTHFSLRGPRDVAVDLADMTSMRCLEAVERLVGEARSVVHEARHHVTPGLERAAAPAVGVHKSPDRRATDVTTVAMGCDVRKGSVCAVSLRTSQTSHTSHGGRVR